MERDAEIERLVSRRQKHAEAPTCLVGGGERAAARLLRRVFDAKQAEHGVAHERHDLAAVIEHGRRRHLEVTAEQAEEGFGGQAVGERRRPAQIAVPQRRRDLLAVAAPDQAVQHRLAGALAEIGMGDILRDAALDLGLERDGELAGDALQLGNLAVGEAGGSIAQPRTEDAVLRRPGRSRPRTGHSRCRPRRRSSSRVSKSRSAVSPVSRRRRMGRRWASTWPKGLRMNRSRRPLVGLVELDHGAASGIPAHDAGVVERVKDPEGDLAAQDRQADAAQALAQLAIERARFGIVQRLAGQPFEDGVAQNRRLRRLHCPCAVTLSKISRMASAFRSDERPSLAQLRGRRHVGLARSLRSCSFRGGHHGIARRPERHAERTARRERRWRRHVAHHHGPARPAGLQGRQEL